MAIRYLFCINTGRSGSDYLTELLAQAENTVSLHEALPIMSGVPMQQYNEGDEVSLRALLSAIRRSPPPGLSYAYDFNSLLTPGLVLRHLGVRGLLGVGGLVLRGRWGEDYSHRAPTGAQAEIGR